MFNFNYCLIFKMPKFIKNNENLINFINVIEDAKIKDGGSRAFYIYLKKKNE